MTLEIYECGAAQKSAKVVTEHTAPDLIAFDIWAAVRKMKALHSRNYEVTWNAETNEGIIAAGFRIVGRVRRLT